MDDARLGPGLPAAEDAETVRAGREAESAAAETRLWGEGDPSSFSVVVLSGAIRFVVATPFGDDEVFRLEGPALVGLSGLVERRLRRTEARAEAGCRFLRLSEEESRALFSAESPEGAAFRRLALLSASRTIRVINAGLHRFFDGIRRPVDPGAASSGTFPAFRPTIPASPERVREFFETAGVDLPLVATLGFLERTYPEGSRLSRSGEVGSEAYLIQTGRVRVSIRIPGIGEEALAILGPGQIVGEMALLEAAPRSAYLTAHDGPVTVFIVTRDVFQRVLAQSEPGVGRLVAGMATALLGRLEEAIQRSVSFFILASGNHPPAPAGTFEGFDEPAPEGASADD